MHYSEGGSGGAQIFAARGGYLSSVALGPANGPVSASGVGGLSGRIVFNYNGTAIGGFSVGGTPSSSTASGHKSLLIGTPESSPSNNYGSGMNVDIGTFSSAGNTWNGERPKLRYTAKEHVIRVDSSTGMNNPGQTVLTVNAVGGAGTVHVSSILHLQPTSSPPTCDAASEGAVFYSASLKTLCLCNGTAWSQLAGGEAC